MNIKMFGSTHVFLTASLAKLSPAELKLYSTKPHTIRKIQDGMCYIHAKFCGDKIFDTKSHSILERVIRSNLKLFDLQYIEIIPPERYARQMIREALTQEKMLKSTAPLLTILTRLEKINYFLSYSYSRSLDYFNDMEK